MTRSMSRNNKGQFGKTNSQVGENSDCSQFSRLDQQHTLDQSQLTQQQSQLNKVLETMNSGFFRLQRAIDEKRVSWLSQMGKLMYYGNYIIKVFIIPLLAQSNPKTHDNPERVMLECLIPKVLTNLRTSNVGSNIIQTDVEGGRPIEYPNVHENSLYGVESNVTQTNSETMIRATYIPNPVYVKIVVEPSATLPRPRT